MQTFAQEDNSWFIAGERESLPPKSTPNPSKGEGKPPPAPPKEGSASLRANSELIIKFKVQWSKFNGQWSKVKLQSSMVKS